MDVRPGVRELHDGLVAARLPAAAVQHGRDRGPEHDRCGRLSGIVVAYGFARFRFPFKNVLFIILIATIILPFQVTLIPPYVIFTKLGWNGTWLPLIVPHFFANAYNVFLLRQYFMSIPRDLDEAAMIDGASPFRILRSIIVPLSVPAIVAVSLFHFFFAWNDFFVPLLYLVEQAGPPAAVDRRSSSTTRCTLRSRRSSRRRRS